MRTRLTTTALAAALAAVTGLPGMAAPVLALQTPGLVNRAGGPGPPPPGGGGYSHLAYSQVSITGDTRGPGIDGSQYPGPPCWMEPRFTGANSWHRGDPQPAPNFDADSYWWWFAQQEPSFAPNAHYPGASQLVNRVFRKAQGQAGWWWVPAWLSGSAGMGCALGLVSSLGLNNGFLNFTPPGNPDTGGQGEIDGQTLAYLARAALALPTIHIHTSPNLRLHPSDVNLPVWVWVTYGGAMRPSDTASVPMPGGALTARVYTMRGPQLRVDVNTSTAQRYNSGCGATGRRYHGGNGPPSCGVIFYAPSTGGPFTLTVTATWTIAWRDSLGGHGTFINPPAVVTAARQVTVREIQSVNNG